MNNLDTIKKWLEKTFKFEPFEFIRGKATPKTAFGYGKHQGSKKGARHQHNPVWLPGTPSISPADYRHKHMGRRK